MSPKWANQATDVKVSTQSSYYDIPICQVVS